MLRNDYEGQICSIARTLELIGERWSLLVIREVFIGNRRVQRDAARRWASPATCSPTASSRLVDEGILERRALQRAPGRATSTS